jgi:hypothetical protein
VSGETILAAGYAALLIVGAFALEWLSAHTHRRALRFRNSGFAYDAVHDYWQCPEGEQLWPHELDHERRLVRYRAKPQICNACPRKQACTDSDRGREIVRAVDPWPHSEAGRFHRVIALLLVGLGMLILLAEAARHHRPGEAGLLLAVFVVGALAGRWLARDLRRHPSGFPDPTPSHGVHLMGSRLGERRDRR